MEASVLTHMQSPLNGQLDRRDFGEDFVWGVSSSAYQTEGAYLDDDKGASIWDDFTSRKGVIEGGHHARHACDFYHRYHDDLNMIAQLGLKNFRFSISWPRILPEGTGKINPEGLAYYHRLIDRCIELDIEPWITLYHWDLPLALEKRGGWTNREMLGWFENYAKLCAEQFGDRVKHWMILNEPLVFTGAGYFFGVHAPGKKSLNQFLAAVHHATMCQAIGGRAIRSVVPKSKIGTTISCSEVVPMSSSPADHQAAIKVDALLNRWFVEPFLGLGYPLKELPALGVIEKFMQPGDHERMVFDFDFLGIQTYTREVVKYSMFTPIVKAKLIPANKRTSHLTAMNWEIYPPGIYNMLMKFSSYSGIKEVVVTENGAAFEDEPKGSMVQDQMRMQYLDDHIQQMHRAKTDGAKVKGYFVWTLLDNFEWAEGYRPRFGLIYVDFKTQNRVYKESALWFSEFITA